MKDVDARRRILENPFYVLSLRPTATRAEIEREGQKLLGMLELDLSTADTYATPLGSEERTPDKVREAMAELRDPEKRLVHELWAWLEPQVVVALDDDEAGSKSGARWPEALEALGWNA